MEKEAKHAEIRQSVDKVQRFDDAVASRIEQQSAFGGKKPGLRTGAYFKRLDTNRDGVLQRGESDEVDQLFADYAVETDKITFEQFKRGVRKALKRHKADDARMGGGAGTSNVAAGHLGR